MCYFIAFELVRFKVSRCCEMPATAASFLREFVVRVSSLTPRVVTAQGAGGNDDFGFMSMSGSYMPNTFPQPTGGFSNGPIGQGFGAPAGAPAGGSFMQQSEADEDYENEPPLLEGEAPPLTVVAVSTWVFLGIL